LAQGKKKKKKGRKRPVSVSDALLACEYRREFLPLKKVSMLEWEGKKKGERSWLRLR